MGHNIFTTGEVAKICSVSSPTVIKWIDSGMLNGFRDPSTDTRRVAKEDLLIFMKEYGIPLDSIEGIRTKILVIDDDINFCKMLQREFDLDDNFDALIVQNAFRAGVVLEKFKPDVILIDIFLGGIDGRELCKFIRKNLGLKRTRVVGMSGIYIQEAILGQDENWFDAFLKKPFKFSELKYTVQDVQDGQSDSSAYVVNGS